MRTAIISDLHLGATTGEDVARDPEIRRALLDEIAGAERLVLLGDAIELREQPLPIALERARPFFEEVGEAIGDGEVMLVPGNHDHRFAEPLLERINAGGQGALGLARTEPAADGPAATIAGWLGGARLTVSYPGVWVRDDVYATHGHYMDCHMTLPRLECLATATVMRIFGSIPDRAKPADYEKVLQPIYGFTHGMAQAGLAQRAHRPSERAWRAISGRRRPRGRIRDAALRATVGAGVPATIWALNRTLRSDFEPILTAEAITRSGIAAATETCRRLGLVGVDVITGHTHRPGPLDGEAEWVLDGGGRLHNTGSWTFASAFHHPGTPPGPYWPGTVTWVEESGPPRRVRLLTGRSREEMRAAVARSAASAALA